MDVLDRNYAKKLVTGLQSGLDHATVDNTTCSITFYWKDGTNAKMTFPKPSNGVSVADIKLKEVTVGSDEETHLICTLDDGTEIDAGNIPGGSEGTTDYADLTNKPSINSIELSGNKTLTDLGITNYDDTDIKKSINAKASISDVTAHTSDTGIHITSYERTKWNNKAEMSDIPSLTNYATKTYVTDEINKASLSGTVDLTAYAKTADVNTSLSNKVDKVTGKSLISDTEIERLATINNYDDTYIKKDIADLKADKQDKTDNTLNTTDKTVVGAINEINGNALDNVAFSADYKNIIINRKSGLNPYTIPIASIINNAKLTELNDVDSANIGNGKTLIYDSSTQKHKYVDSTGTDELVKMDSTTNAKHLSELIDKNTIVNDGGVLKAKKLDGQEVTIAEINYLKGLTMNVMDLVNAFSNGGVKVLNTPVNTYADLSTLDRSSFIDGISYIVYVLADETHSGAKTTYLCNKTSETFFGNADSQRNFTTDPINLANEVTGKLGTANIDVDSLWSLLTINDTYKTLTTKNEVFGTHGAKALYDELVTSIGGKANATDLTSHTGDTNIHITTAERTAWNNKANSSDLTSHTGDTNIHVTTSDKTKWNNVDNKVNKTDIIDNLTSTNTDKPLSAKQGKVLKGEVDLKANETEVVKKTDITTTIKSTSTDTQVPSALATFNLLKTVYPVGSIYINTTDVNPSTIFGFGTWERVAQNMTLWGSSADGEAGTTKSAGLPNITGKLELHGGEKPSIIHSLTGAFTSEDMYDDFRSCVDLNLVTGAKSYGRFSLDASLSNSIYGNSTTVQPPALVVNIWKRTA